MGLGVFCTFNLRSGDFFKVLNKQTLEATGDIPVLLIAYSIYWGFYTNEKEWHSSARDNLKNRKALYGTVRYRWPFHHNAGNRAED